MYFRILADMLHLASLLILIQKIRQSKSCLGISCKTQEVYLIVFICRYLDLFMYFVSLYNTSMKLGFIVLTGYLIYLMRMSKIHRQTYDVKGDSFNYFIYLLPACLLLSLVFTAVYTPMEILWTFSILLESVAFVPQLDMLRKMKEVENMTSNYVFCLGAYRVSYIIHWVLRILASESISWISLLAGVIQSALYGDFFYYYAKAKLSNQKSVPIWLLRDSGFLCVLWACFSIELLALIALDSGKS